MDKNRDFDEQFAPMPLITDSTSPLPDKNDSTASSESEIADTAPLSRKTSKCKKRAFFNIIIIIVLVVSASISTVIIPLFTKDDKNKSSLVDTRGMYSTCRITRRSSSRKIYWNYGLITMWTDPLHGKIARYAAISTIHFTIHLMNKTKTVFWKQK